MPIGVAAVGLRRKAIVMAFCLASMAAAYGLLDCPVMARFALEPLDGLFFFVTCISSLLATASKGRDMGRALPSSFSPRSVPPAFSPATLPPSVAIPEAKLTESSSISLRSAELKGREVNTVVVTGVFDAVCSP